MKKIRKYFVISLIGITCLLINSLFAACAFGSSNVIKFATEATYPPYVYVDASGKDGKYRASELISFERFVSK